MHCRYGRNKAQNYVTKEDEGDSFLLPPEGSKKAKPAKVIQLRKTRGRVEAIHDKGKALLHRFSLLHPSKK